MPLPEDCGFNEKFNPALELPSEQLWVHGVLRRRADLLLDWIVEVQPQPLRPPHTVPGEGNAQK
jgi:hypothetical protein